MTYMYETESSARLNTNKLLEMVEEGIVSEKQVIIACLSYMSEADVTEMMEMNEWLEEEDVDDDYEDDDDDEEYELGDEPDDEDWGEGEEEEEWIAMTTDPALAKQFDAVMK